jgi:uncharacterized protein
MIVVSDTSAITSLVKIGRLDLLHEIFGGVLIPRAVRAELDVVHLELPAWVQERPVHDRALVSQLAVHLDFGESEAIALALETGSDFLLIDEKLGREVALEHGIEIIGVIGVALIAKQRGLIDSVGVFMAQLKAQASFRLSADLEWRILRDSGEA